MSNIIGKLETMLFAFSINGNSASFEAIEEAVDYINRLETEKRELLVTLNNLFNVRDCSGIVRNAAIDNAQALITKINNEE